MHNNSAGKYYKINMAFLFLFLATSVFTYKFNEAVFWNQRFAKFYLGVIITSILGIWVFANKHVQCIYLLNGQKNIGVLTYSNFGLTINKMQELPIESLKGTRLFWTKEMNIYQLEYNFKGRLTQLTKQRSLFYRPEFISN